MELILQVLIDSLKTSLQHLNGDGNGLLQAALHATEKLPDQRVLSMALEALDLLSEVRLLLEPGHLVLADHFLGM
jgi:gliotoxin/aspirochlorine biosynthesis O-methyltransferase